MKERKLTRNRIRAIFDYGYYVAKQEFSNGGVSLRVTCREEIVNELMEMKK